MIDSTQTFDSVFGPAETLPKQSKIIGLSKNQKIAIGLSALSIIGIVVYLSYKKMKEREEQDAEKNNTDNFQSKDLKNEPNIDEYLKDKY